jgi:hypothetical protein
MAGNRFRRGTGKHLRDDKGQATEGYAIAIPSW